MGHLVESKSLVHVGMSFQPEPLGFEAKDAAVLHDDEEHDQDLIVIDKGMPLVGTGGVVLPKAFKQGTQQVDIVGKGRLDHSGASWTVFSVFSRGNLPPPTMSMHLCTPLNYLHAVILEPLKRKLSSRDASNGGELLFNLAEKEVAVDFPVSSLNSHTIISATVNVAGNPSADGSQPQYTELKCQSTAQGEATFADDGISQFGVSAIQAYPSAGPGSPLWSSSELTERGIAPWCPVENFQKREWRARLGYSSASATSTESRKNRCLEIQSNLQPIMERGISNEIIQQVENMKTGFEWETIMAWKALGESSE
jgi:hypothetical protein